jgi:hypothetical protein
MSSQPHTAGRPQLPSPRYWTGCLGCLGVPLGMLVGILGFLGSTALYYRSQPQLSGEGGFGRFGDALQAIVCASLLGAVVGACVGWLVGNRIGQVMDNRSV